VEKLFFSEEFLRHYNPKGLKSAKKEKEEREYGACSLEQKSGRKCGAIEDQGIYDFGKSQ
jgi:hypothetical protein